MLPILYLQTHNTPSVVLEVTIGSPRLKIRNCVLSLILKVSPNLTKRHCCCAPPPPYFGNTPIHPYNPPKNLIKDLHRSHNQNPQFSPNLCIP